MPTKDPLITAIDSARREQRVTQQQLADAAGCSLRTMADWLRGRNPNMSAAAVSAAMQRLGVEITRAG